MRLMTFAVALAALALLGAGCGGGDDSSSATDTDTTEITDTTATDETTTDETTTDTDTDTNAADFASEECLKALGASSEFAQALGNLGSDNEGLAESSQLFEEFADNAPEEVRADFQIVAEAYAAYVEVLRGLDLQAGETPSAEQLAAIQEATTSFTDPEVTAASERIQAWGEENCPSG
jgi:hypothetical protein